MLYDIFDDLYRIRMANIGSINIIEELKLYY